MEGERADPVECWEMLAGVNGGGCASDVQFSDKSGELNQKSAAGVVWRLWLLEGAAGTDHMPVANRNIWCMFRGGRVWGGSTA